MLTVCTWLWGEKYGPEDVAKLAAGVKRNMRQAYRFVLFSDRIVDLPGVECFAIRDPALLEIPGCFARLRLFDPELQREIGADERIACLDLDMVIVRGIDEVFDREGPFHILQNINGTNPCPYNGSVWMLRAGFRPDVWSDFSLEAYHRLKVPFHAIPDDQGWLYHKLPGAGVLGPEQGVYGFQKNGWPGQERLPPNARIVAFPGWRSPAQFQHVKWIKENWRT